MNVEGVTYNFTPRFVNKTVQSMIVVGLWSHFLACDVTAWILAVSRGTILVHPSVEMISFMHTIQCTHTIVVGTKFDLNITYR